MNPTPAGYPQDARIDAILDVLARHARLQRHDLLPHLSSDEIGLSPLDLALALFEIEDRFDIDLPLSPVSHAITAPTLHALVVQLLACIDGRVVPEPG